MKKVLFLVPHLSTGGMPQCTYDLMRKIKNEVEVYCVEYSLISNDFVVQRNRIIDLLGNRFFCLGDDKMEIFSIINEIDPDIIHLQEMPEYFLDQSVAARLYSESRQYLIVETSHDSSFSSSNKRFFPDHFALISQYQKNEFSKLEIPIDFVEADIEYKERQDRTQGLLKLGLDPNLKHVVNVGLFTPRKNQAEAIEYARSLQNYPIQFHFIGNQADNFKGYWEPLLQNLPPNVKIWGERSDVDDFYSCMDMMLFTSRGTGNDKETSPLVIRESIGHHLPALIFNLPVYLGMYDKYETIHYMDFESPHKNLELIVNTLGLFENTQSVFHVNYDNSMNKVIFSGDRNLEDVTVSIRDIDSLAVIWSAKYEEFHSGINYWIIPVPKNHYDFESEPNFGGLLVEFYSKNTLLDKTEIRIKQPQVFKPKTKINNITEPTFFNYNEFHIQKIYDKYLANKHFETVFDVGANIGLWTEYLKSVADVNRFYLVEPNRRALNILNSSYGNDNTVTIVGGALTNKDGEIDLFVSDENSLVSSIVEEHKKIFGFGNLNGVERSKSFRFSTLLSEYKIEQIDLLKLDIEGAEYDLFESMTGEDYQKIQNILFEYHFNDSRNMDDVHGLIRLLESFDFVCDLNVMDSGGGFVFATKERTLHKKIRAVQFLLNGDYDKQNKSIENISKIQNIGIEYVQHFNDVYVDLPPVSKSNRPHDVSIELKPNALTPAHYGCFDSFRTAVLSEFDNELDCLIVMEGDAKIQDYSLFREKLIESVQLAEKHNLGFISLGGIYDLEFGVLQSNVVENLSEDFFVCDKIIGCQCLVFPSSSRNLIKDILRKEKWDALDIYLNTIAQKYGIRIGVSRKTLVTQYDGISTIDSVVKQFKEFSL